MLESSSGQVFSQPQAHACVMCCRFLAPARRLPPTALATTPIPGLSAASLSHLECSLSICRRDRVMDARTRHVNSCRHISDKETAASQSSTNLTGPHHSLPCKLHTHLPRQTYSSFSVRNTGLSRLAGTSSLLRHASTTRFQSLA